MTRLLSGANNSNRKNLMRWGKGDKLMEQNWRQGSSWRGEEVEREEGEGLFSQLCQGG